MSLSLAKVAAHGEHFATERHGCLFRCPRLAQQVVEEPGSLSVVQECSAQLFVVSRIFPAGLVHRRHSAVVQASAHLETRQVRFSALFGKPVSPGKSHVDRGGFRAEPQELLEAGEVSVVVQVVLLELGELVVRVTHVKGLEPVAVVLDQREHLHVLLDHDLVVGVVVGLNELAGGLDQVQGLRLQVRQLYRTHTSRARASLVNCYYKFIRSAYGVLGFWGFGVLGF